MASRFAAKGLPPPPLQIDKRHDSPSTKQSNHSRQWPELENRAATSSSGTPSHLNMAPSQRSGPSVALPTNSGRFRLRVPSLTRQSRAPATGSSVVPAAVDNAAPQSSSSQEAIKVWQPRWAPKLKRTTPSDSVTTYSPILSPPLPPLPDPAASVASPPPALHLDDTGFGRPFSTAGLLDLNASRFSFLDMSNPKDHDSDSEREAPRNAASDVPPPPLIQEPLTEQHGEESPVTAPTSIDADREEPALSSSSLRPHASRDALRVPLSSSPNPGTNSRSPQPSLPTSSPALASLISSFPSPTSREGSSTAMPATNNSSVQSRNAPVMLKENSWDGGERWVSEARKHRGAPGAHASTELPYLDMEDDDTELLEASLAEPVATTIRPAIGTSSVSPPRNRPIRNPPPRPAPNMALPDLPPKSLASASVDGRQHTPPGVAQMDSQQQGSGPASGRSSKQGQRPLILPTLRSSSSIDRLAAMQTTTGSSSSSPSTGPALRGMPTSTTHRRLTLQRNASTEELAKSLDIPRDAVKQMLDTTQHVWRSHLLGSAALQTDAPSNNGIDRLPRPSSSPMLSTLFAGQNPSNGSLARQDLSMGGRAMSPASRSSNRISSLGLPYITSSRLSFEQQSPAWASKNNADARRPSAFDLQAERAKHRRTFLGRSSEDGPAPNYNFSRPIRRDGSSADAGLGASASMPCLAAVRVAPKPPAVLQSPLLLKGESEATGFAQFAVDDEEEVLVDSSSEAHGTFSLARPLTTDVADADASSSNPPASAARKPALELLQNTRNPPPKLARRNSDTVLHRFAPEFGKRIPGELHAWSVCIDDDGVPAIRPSASAFHRPTCPLAGKNNATWQCGCRDFIVTATKTSPTPASGTRTVLSPGQSSPTRNRSLSASSVMDPVRQALLWSQVEQNKELIRKHEQEIAGLQEQVVRISTEIASGRPSMSSAFATPEHASAPVFPCASATANAIARKPLPSIASSESDNHAPPVPSKVKSIEPFPSVSAAPTSGMVASALPCDSAARTLRGRIASLSKMNLTARNEGERSSQSLDLGHSRLRSSSSTSSLNKIFRFPWLRTSDKETTFPDPTPFPVGERGHAKAASATFSREKALPSVRMYSVDEGRPLPAPPVSDAMVSNKDKRYPPSSRKYSYHSSVGSRHLRGRSGSSKSSSFGTGTSIFSANESNEMHESSRFASFPRLGRRWDSISSRATSASARNSAEVAQPNIVSHASVPALSTLAVKAMPPAPSDPEVGSRGSTGEPAQYAKTPPPRRSSLRKSLEAAPRRTPIPSDFLHAKDAVMAPISEQSELGSPASVRVATNRVDMEMSPGSMIEGSPAGPVRMSMSERYHLRGLTVPAPLPLSSSLASPALDSMTDPGSGTKVEGAPRSPTSPRSVRSPLPVAFSHGALTVARQPSLKS